MALLFILVAVAACNADADDRPAPAERSGTASLVVVTIHPVASVTSALAGGAATVRTLLPPGAHPDTYQTTPRDAEAVAGADLLVRVGGAVDAWVGTPAGVSTLLLTEGMSLEGQAGPGTGNAHVWLDPIIVRDRFLPLLVEALSGLTPDSADAVRARASAYSDSLTALDAEIRALLADVSARRFVAAHPAWTYFADRYGLEEAGVVHESPGHEPGSRGLARLVREAREKGVRAVIAEPQLGSGGVDAMAGELRARVAVADPVGGASMEGRADYLSLMRFNARAFAEALGGRSP